jgi:hypothetical protein
MFGWSAGLTPLKLQRSRLPPPGPPPPGLYCAQLTEPLPSKPTAAAAASSAKAFAPVVIVRMSLPFKPGLPEMRAGSRRPTVDAARLPKRAYGRFRQNTIALSSFDLNQVLESAWQYCKSNKQGDVPAGQRHFRHLFFFFILGCFISDQVRSNAV